MFRNDEEQFILIVRMHEVSSQAEIDAHELSRLHFKLIAEKGLKQVGGLSK